jgi:hypothetical protein
MDPKIKNTLEALRAAKAESDRGNYGEKNKILNALISASPGEFKITDPRKNHPGVTHIPTNFQIHTSWRNASIIDSYRKQKQNNKKLIKPEQSTPPSAIPHTLINGPALNQPMIDDFIHKVEGP